MTDLFRSEVVFYCVSRTRTEKLFGSMFAPLALDTFWVVVLNRFRKKFCFLYNHYPH